MGQNRRFVSYRHGDAVRGDAVPGHVSPEVDPVKADLAVRSLMRRSSRPSRGNAGAAGDPMAAWSVASAMGGGGTRSFRSGAQAGADPCGCPPPRVPITPISSHSGSAPNRSA